MSSFGASLRKLRLSAGLTQEALAERSGLSAKAVGELERNPGRSPRLETVTLLAEALELGPDERARLLAAARPPDQDAYSGSRTARPLHNMPRLLTPLIGRVGALEVVASLVRRSESRLVTLTGPGGVGKTRLAIEVAERVVDAFADGIAFVDLSPIRDPALVLPTIAQHLGVDERGDLPLGDRLESVLRDQQLLLVLDNLEHLVAVGADLLGLLIPSPKLAILATSRIPLRVRGEREYRVAPLELPPEAVHSGDLERSASAALFLDRVRATGVDLQLSDETSAVVAEICRRLDGLPLALELAAAWAPLLPPAALLERLERRLPLLAGGPSDLPARQRTMFDAIDWSYSLLDSTEQRLFRRMSVFTGGCSVEAATAVCADGTSEHAVLTGLAALLDKNLLRRDETESGIAPPRLVMLETIREYGLERLEESGEDQMVRARHARFFLEVTENAAPAVGKPDQLVWATRLELDQDNVRAALSWVCDQGDSSTGLRFAAALWRLWSAGSHGREARRWLERILALPVDGVEDRPDIHTRIRVQTGAALLALEYGALDDAGAKIADCLTHAQEHGDGSVLVDTLNAAGLIARTRGEYDDAIKDLEEAYAIASSDGYRAGEATALAELALNFFLLGDTPRAQGLLSQSIELHRKLGDMRGLAAGLRDLGWMIWHEGDSARGEELREEALALFRTLGDAGQVAETLWGLGISVQYRGDYARAIELFEESLALRRSRDDDRGTAQVLSTLGQASLHQRDVPAARTMLTDAFNTTRRLGDRWGQAMILAILGHVELVSGHLGHAREFFREATVLYAEIGNLLYLPWCLEGFAGIAIVEGRANEAATILGARDAMLDIVGRGLPAADPQGYANTTEMVRATLDEDVFNVEFESGRSLTQDEIIALLNEQSRIPLITQLSCQNDVSSVLDRIAKGAPKK